MFLDAFVACTQEFFGVEAFFRDRIPLSCYKKWGIFCNRLPVKGSGWIMSGIKSNEESDEKAEGGRFPARISRILRLLDQSE